MMPRHNRTRFWLGRHALAAALASALGCAGSGGGSTVGAPEADSAQPANEPPADPPPMAGEPAVTRSELLATLDRGPGAFLQGLEVEAHFEGGAFAGWVIVSLGDRRARYEAAGIQPGDVITTVNDHGLERPEYLHAIFVELRRASAIVVQGERAGEAFEIRIPVADDLE